MTIPDVVLAAVTYLQADAGVAALAGARVFGAEVPALEAKSMPRQALVVRYAGGMGPRDDVPIQAPRLDVWAYGATPGEASALYLAAHGALRALARAVHAGALLHSAIQGGGPISGRDPDTRWPFVWGSWVITAGEDPAQ
ncbi:MAG TPA: DUF3168 domain-containing protein [Candidatus Omnitrophota bacterium]|nr:DUF3168 domain-containing protein [Candidatus Omnitrophota bacterium]